MRKKRQSALGWFDQIFARHRAWEPAPLDFDENSRNLRISPFDVAFDATDLALDILRGNAVGEVDAQREQDFVWCKMHGAQLVDVHDLVRSSDDSANSVDYIAARRLTDQQTLGLPGEQDRGAGQDCRNDDRSCGVCPLEPQ